MDRSVSYWMLVPKFLDRLLEKNSDRLLAGLGFPCFALIRWILSRLGPNPVQPISLVRLSQSHARKREPDARPL